MSPTRRSTNRSKKPVSASNAARDVDDASEPSLIVFSRTGIRSVDEAAVRELGIPSLLLMEHASLALARHAIEIADGGSVVVVCGKGANGGDGFALARHLFVREIPVFVVLSQDDGITGDAAVNLQTLRAMGVPLMTAHPETPGITLEDALLRGSPVGLVVDALLGTGASGPPRGAVAELIRVMNNPAIVNVPILSVDIPSGMDADTGEATGDGGEIVAATRTVTFVGLKKGFLSLHAQRFLGDVCVEEIGTPRSLAARFGETLPMEPPGAPEHALADPAPTPGPRRLGKR